MAITDIKHVYFQFKWKLTDKVDRLSEVGSKIGVDIVVDWDPQVLHAPVFEAVGMIAGSVDDVCYVLAFECTETQFISRVT